MACESSAWTIMSESKDLSSAMSSSISSASRCGNSSTPEWSRKHLKPKTPSSCSGRRSFLLPGMAPPQNPTSTNAWSSATSRLSLRPSTVVVGGMELSGMSMMVVTPPAAAARVADAKPSHSVRPGSLTWTWVSTRPGRSVSSSASSITSAPERPLPSGSIATILPPRTPTSRAAMPAVVRMRLPRMTRSKVSSDIQGLLCAGTVGWRGGIGRGVGRVRQLQADVLSQLFKQGCRFGYTYIYLGLQRGERVDLPETGFLLLLGRERGAPADGRHGHPGQRRRAGHAHGRLAQQALLVEAAFAGDHQVGAGQPVRQFGEFKHDVDARPARRGQYRDGRVTDAAGGSGARSVRG